MGQRASHIRSVNEDRPPPWTDTTTSSSPPPPPSKKLSLYSPPMPDIYPLAHKPRLVQAVSQSPIRLTGDLGKYDLALAYLLKDQGWERLVINKRGHSNLHDNIGSIPHPSARLLNHYHKAGAQVIMNKAP